MTTPTYYPYSTIYLRQRMANASRVVVYAGAAVALLAVAAVVLGAFP